MVTFDLEAAARLYPWRIGWRSEHPRRPCYTCGAPPVGIFVDGSPRYAATCSHPPITDDNPTIDMTPVRIVVTLTEEQIERTAKRTERVIDDDHARGWQMKHAPPRGETEYDVKLRGFGAEMAASIGTGLPLNWDYLPSGYTRAGKRPDIGRRTEVRNTKKLRAYPGEKPDFLYLWVPGRMPTFTIFGWLEGVDLMVPAFEDIRYGGWTCEAGDLNPLPLPKDA